MSVAPMLTVARVIGLIIGLMGSILLVSPKTMKQLIAFWSVGERIYLAGLLRVLIGIALLSSRGCRWPLVVALIGLLILIKGVLIFILGAPRIKPLFSWWENGPALLVRLAGLFALSIGLLLYYAVGFGPR